MRSGVKGKLLRKELVNIVNSIDVSVQYNINVITDPSEMEKKLILVTNKKMDSSIMEGTDESGQVIMGDGTFGKDECICYNGDISCIEEGKEKPYFEVSKILVITKKIRDWRNVEGDASESFTNQLIIYIP